MAANGLPALRYLTTTDQTERIILATIANEIAAAIDKEARRARG